MLTALEKDPGLALILHGSDLARRWVLSHTFSLSAPVAEAGRSLEFKASLVHKTRFETARATQRNPVLTLHKLSKTNKNYIFSEFWFICMFE